MKNGIAAAVCLGFILAPLRADAVTYTYLSEEFGAATSYTDQGPPAIGSLPEPFAPNARFQLSISFDAPLLADMTVYCESDDRCDAVPGYVPGYSPSGPGAVPPFGWTADYELTIGSLSVFRPSFGSDQQNLRAFTDGSGQIFEFVYTSFFDAPATFTDSTKVTLTENGGAIRDSKQYCAELFDLSNCLQSAPQGAVRTASFATASFTSDVTPVPLPSGVLMLLSGLALPVAMMRRRADKSA